MATNRLVFSESKNILLLRETARFGRLIKKLLIFQFVDFISQLWFVTFISWIGLSNNYSNTTSSYFV